MTANALAPGVTTSLVDMVLVVNDRHVNPLDYGKGFN